MQKLASDIILGSNEFMNRADCGSFLTIEGESNANHLSEWMGGTKCNPCWLLPIKTHTRKELVIEKELSIDYLNRVDTSGQYHKVNEQISPEMVDLISESK